MQCVQAIDGPVAVIGDVHGQIRQLDSILEKLKTLPDYQDRWIVFIGDLVDRGPDSRGVVERIIELSDRHGKVTSVMGNHELAMGFATGLFEAPEYSDWDSRWCDFYGAEATFASYDVEFPDCSSLRAAIPDEHSDFYKNLPWAIEHPEFFFVHAGLDPNQGFEMQRRILQERDFSLSRPPWLCAKEFANERIPADCDKVVVSGHVPVPEVQAWPQRILIDTTGGVEGDLSCVLLPERILISSAQEPVRAPSPSSRKAIHQPQRKASPQKQNRPQDRSNEVSEAEPVRPRWYEFWK